MNISLICTQDLIDVMSSAKLGASNEKAIFNEMFRASFGGLFCQPGSSFCEKINAYDANSHRLGDVLTLVGDEIEQRING